MNIADGQVEREMNAVETGNSIDKLITMMVAMSR